ncbi:BnaC06g03170D [Brassica napus]|uniref:BnaC06g03170D protein n=1 Tax=Brassica napus TaxID=3708 RepID=A0A078GRR3_BRANA|nr:BnaC06g03170D [Brassica napus]
MADSQTPPTASDAAAGGLRSPWTKPPHVEAPTPPGPIDGVVSLTIPEEILADPNPLWRCCVVGYFIGDAPHIGSIHATVNRLWSSSKMGSKIDVQFLEKNTVLFRIENPQVSARVIQRRYRHIADVPLVVNEWSPETALAPPDLSAMPMWIDLKGVSSLLFSHKALKCLSRAAGKFVKLHPSTEKCTRLDVARVLVEVNLHSPLVEKIQCLDRKGAEVEIDVSYPWLPPPPNAISAMCGDTKGIISHQRRFKCCRRLEALPPALGSGVVGDVSRNYFEIGGTSNAPKKIDATLESDWALIGGKTPHSPQQRTDELGGMGEETNIIISPSRFSVLAVVDGDEIGEEETEEKEEGEIEEEESTADEHKVDLKKKDVAKSVRLQTGTSLKLSKQIPAHAKDPKTGRNNTSDDFWARKLPDDFQEVFQATSRKSSDGVFSHVSLS